MKKNDKARKFKVGHWEQVFFHPSLLTQNSHWNLLQGSLYIRIDRSTTGKVCHDVLGLYAVLQLNLAAKFNQFRFGSGDEDHVDATLRQTSCILPTNAIRGPGDNCKEWVSLIERMKVHEGLYVLQEVVHI